MRPLTKLIILYLSTLTLVSLTNVTFGGQISIFLKSVGFWISPIVFIGIGVLFGLLINIIRNNPKHNGRILFLSAITSCFIICLTIFLFRLSWWDHERKFGNIEHNEDYFKYWSDTYTQEKKLAFNTLISKFDNKNDIRISQISASFADTIINHLDQVFYTIDIRYYKDRQIEPYKASVIIHHDTAYLKFFDRQLTFEEISKIDSIRNEVIQGFRDGLKAMPDSMRKETKKEFRDILK